MTFTLERTKLAIRHIPPALCEDEFSELIAEWIEKSDYFSFFPGKVHKDAYGKILQKETPTYGCAHLNFKSSKDLVRFFREFNGKVLTDSCGFKAKLLIDFAQLQQIPDLKYAKPNPACGTYKTSLIYQQFLQAHPEFIPKSPTNQEFDLDNPDLSAFSPLRTPTENEMDKIIDSGPSPELSLMGPKFAEIVKAEERKLAQIQTPLTAYVIKRLRKGRKNNQDSAPTTEPVKSKPEPSENDVIVLSSTAPKQTRRQRNKAKKLENAQINANQTSQQVQPEPKLIEQNHSAKPAKTKQQPRPKHISPVDQNTQKNEKSNPTVKSVPQKSRNQAQKPTPASPPENQTQQQTPKNAPKILARKQPAPVEDVPAPAITPTATAKTKQPAPNKSNNKAAKKDSIKALLNSDQSKVEAITSTVAATTQPKRVFTTAAKKQDTQ